MPTPIDPKRLPALKAAKRRFKPGDMLPQQELAKIYGVSNARLTTLIHQRFGSFPPAERHGDKTHWYEALPALDAMIAYLTGNEQRKHDAGRRVAAVLAQAPATEAPADREDPAPPTAAELDKLASAQTRSFRLLQEKKQFVRVDAHRHVVRELFTTTQRSVTSLPMEIDPNGELPPLHRERLETAVRDAMLKIHASVAAVLEVPDAA